MSAPESLPKVFVGMSGGVDSSVAAALLVEQGYRVTGVYMKNWSRDLPGMTCPWADDLADAKRVAVHLGIDFKVYDFEKDYRHKVVDYMIKEYQLGRTPNPDIMCNQEIKFKLFLETALENGAGMIATGHYARVVTSRQSLVASKEQPATGDKRLTTTYQLHMATDKLKDQTYFLYRVSERALSRTIFPIGDFKTKAQVRALAKKFNLPTADKKDSQGICFVGKVGIREFLSQYVETSPGDIIDLKTGKVLGQHDGAIFFTLGQRHGLEIGGGLPYYVAGKDMKKNEVYVTTNLTEKNLWRTSLKLKDFHWIHPFWKDVPSRALKLTKKPSFKSVNQSLEGTSFQNVSNSFTKSLKVRLRHRAPLIDCELHGNILKLANPQRAIASGQSAVLYSGDEVLGGGIIC